MIVCTNCGTRNPDAAHACQTCNRKLQSRWAAPPAVNGQNGQAGGQNSLGAPSGLERPWKALEPLLRTVVDESAAKLVRACAETWLYAFILLGSAGLMLATQDWRYLAGGMVLAGGLAWARGM